LHAVVNHAITQDPAKSIELIGFSLGGNLILKYLGENPKMLPPQIRGAVTFSAPCDLACSSRRLADPSNRIYMERFLIAMRAKIRAKDRMFPGKVDLTGVSRIRTFQEFDDRFTAPIHGFRDAADYWAKNSSRQFMHAIEVPTLLVNALNDPFLGPDCYPVDEAAASAAFYFEMPATGGHVGFPTFGHGGEYWSETRAIRFLDNV
jgi:predicted alpha/beta-fold hydrolase